MTGPRRLPEVGKPRSTRHDGERVERGTETPFKTPDVDDVEHVDVPEQEGDEG